MDARTAETLAQLEGIIASVNNIDALTHDQRNALALQVLSLAQLCLDLTEDEENEEMANNDETKKSYMEPFLEDRIESRGRYWQAVMVAKNKDPRRFYQLCRLWPSEYESLHEMLVAVNPETGEPYMRTRDVDRHRAVVTTQMRLFYYLFACAHGLELEHCAATSQISSSRISLRVVIDEVSDAITKALKNFLPPMGKDLGQMQNYALNFWRLMPNAVGSLDGKHVKIRKPPADLKVQYVDIGAPGAQSDSGVLLTSSFGQDLINGRLLMPKPALLPGRDPYDRTNYIPSCFLGDQAFLLSRWCLVPYVIQTNAANRHFNTRLSRARRTVECVFGMLAARWRIFLGTICMEPDRVSRMVMALCVLHNWLQVTRGSTIDDHFDEDGDERAPLQGVRDHPSLRDRNLDWRAAFDNMIDLEPADQRAAEAIRQMRGVREKIKEWMKEGDGRVPWINWRDC